MQNQGVVVEDDQTVKCDVDNWGQRRCGQFGGRVDCLEEVILIGMCVRWEGGNLGVVHNREKAADNRVPGGFVFPATRVVMRRAVNLDGGVYEV